MSLDSLTRRGAAVVVGVLLVTSMVAPFMALSSPVGTAAGASSNLSRWEYSGDSFVPSVAQGGGMGVGPDGYFYSGDEGSNDYLEKYYSNGTMIKNVAANVGATGVYDVFASDSGKIYAVSYQSGSEIAVFDQSLSNINNIDIPDTAVTGKKDLALTKGPNGKFYLASTDKVTVFDSSWTKVNSHTISAHSRGIIANENGFYILNESGGEVYEYDTSFNKQTTYTLSEIGTGAGLSIDTNGDFWASERGGTGYRYGGEELTDPASGTVVTQSGDPVENATVEVVAVDKKNINPDSGETYKEQANDLLDRAKNPLPDSWSRDTDVFGGSSSLAQNVSGKIAVPYSQKQVSLGVFSGDELKLTPTTPTLPAGKPIVLTSIDTTEESVAEGEFDSRVPGAFVTGEVVVEQLTPTGETKSRTVVETNQASGEGGVLGALDPSDLEYSQITLSPGVYKFYPQGHAERAVVRVVGNPSTLRRAFAQKLETQAGKLSEKAEFIQNKIQNNAFHRKTVSTNSTGHWSASVPESTLVVGVTAHKMPGPMDGSSPNMSEIRAWYASTNSTASMFLSTGPERVDVPASSVTVEVVEASAPSYLGINPRQKIREKFEAFLANLSYSELPPALQQPNASKEVLVSTYAQMHDLVESSPPLANRVDEIADRQGVTVDLENPSDASAAELSQAIAVMRQALAETRASVDTTGGSSSVGEHSVTLTRVFSDNELKPEEVSVSLHLTNGTTQTLTTKSEHVEILHRVGNDAVRVMDVGFGEAAGGRVEILVANSEGTGHASKAFTDPDFSGSRPSLEAIDLSTLAPAPGNSVSMQLEAGEDTIKKIASATVYSPSGSSSSATVTGARSLKFTPSTTGTHVVEVEFKANGHNWTVTQRVDVVEKNHKMPPSVRTVETPYGRTALTGATYTAGDVELKNGGSDVVVTAQIPEGADVPTDATRVYLSGMSLPPETTVETHIVQGPKEQGVDEHLGVVLKLPAMNTDGRETYYRNGNPVPAGGNSKVAFNHSSSTLTVTTYTGTTGEVAITTDSSPGYVEYYVEYRSDLLVPDVGSEN